MAWYVVYRGREPGVYATWATCHAQASGFKNCCYKSFPTKEEVEASYLEFKGCEDDSFCHASTKGGQEQTGLCYLLWLWCSLFSYWCSCGSFLLVSTPACDAQKVPCKLVVTMTL